MAVRHARNERSPSAEIGVRHQPKSPFGLLRNQRSVSPEIHTHSDPESIAVASARTLSWFRDPVQKPAPRADAKQAGRSVTRADGNSRESCTRVGGPLPSIERTR